MGRAAKLALSIGAGALTLAVAYVWRDFPLQLAAVSGLSVGVFLWAAFRAGERLHRIYRRE